ncbi:Non-structural maintenance of chromosome element 4 [Hyphodiscus hymeniophilus]|uniref:Non-structural maintenance of chromosomes element 4 n=1 Tax=Hyphodiscus hymeniophilus TaxID=353542 RepID=A0A9P6VL90_9HELO|nr:Non-structural maintenance of chromosome element 4 [Hyphodiscus hymeniophilus]
MARSTKFSESPSPFGDDVYEASPAPRSRATRRNSNVDISPSPSVSISSDKENRSAGPIDKGKGRAPMGPPSVPIAESGKRRRTVERDESPARSRRRRTVEVDGEDREGTAAYDPDQDIEERRRLRKGLRDLNKNLIENRTDLLNPNSSVLKDTLREADDYAEHIKQTSDATIDSRLLVTTADLSYKKTLALISGDTSQGVDVDEFLSKCMSFMRRAEGASEEDGPRPAVTPASGSTQRRRSQRANPGEDGDDDDDGDMLNWEHLGRFACLQNNSRPSIPGFLLGPLSLEKRARKAIVRKAPLRANNLQETRPEVLEAQDIHRDENANLTTLCTKILTRLEKVLSDAQGAVDEHADESMTGSQIQELMDRYGVSQSGGLALFKFVINPRSFGQTIENIFYVSFLIRDGKVGLTTDDRGMPYLEPTVPRTKAQIEEEGAHKHQSVIALDMAQWEELIELFDIKEPMIKHRVEEGHTAVGATGWYA